MKFQFSRWRIYSWLIMFFFVFTATSIPAQADETIETLRRSIVRIYAVSQNPDYQVPWDPGSSGAGWGSGFIISGQRILTNAHVVSNARFISLEKEGDARRYEARVKYIAHDCDLAILEVVDASFFESTSVLSLGAIPTLDSTVSVLGYPVGGDRLSITRGIVSRIDYRTYAHSGVDSHLVVQIDAAINPGNSGGPVIQNNMVVGVAFQGFNGMVAQNVGYMIPVPVVERFLQDVNDGYYDRYVDLGIQFFPLVNPAQRRALGLSNADNGVMVSEVIRAGAANGFLQVEDVLLSIDGLPIFSDGSVAMGNNRLMLNEVVERKFKGDRVILKLLRKGREMEVSVPLNFPWPYLMQANQYDVRPRFITFGGLIFQPLCNSFYHSLASKSVTLRYYFSQFLSQDIYLQHPEVIVISKILPDPVNNDLDQFVHTIIDKVNDKPIRTLADLAQAFDQPAEFYVIRVIGDPQPLVLEASAVAEARERINQRYGVAQERYLQGSIVPEDWSVNEQAANTHGTP